MDELIVGVGGLVIAVLAYFAGVQRGKIAGRESEERADRYRRDLWRREDEARERDESARRVTSLVERVQNLLTPAGGAHGEHLETLQEAGIRSLNDGEIRAAMREIGKRTRIALPEVEWPQLEDVDLQKVFVAAHGRWNLSGGPPTLLSVVRRMRSDGVDVERGS